MTDWLIGILIVDTIGRHSVFIDIVIVVGKWPTVSLLMLFYRLFPHLFIHSFPIVDIVDRHCCCCCSWWAIRQSHHCCCCCYSDDLILVPRDDDIQYIGDVTTTDHCWPGITFWLFDWPIWPVTFDCPHSLPVTVRSKLLLVTSIRRYW